MLGHSNIANYNFWNLLCLVLKKETVVKMTSQAMSPNPLQNECFSLYAVVTTFKLMQFLGIMQYY